MDKLRKVEQIWSMLDDMAASDPAGYKKFVGEQIKQGIDSLPKPKLCVKTSISNPYRGVVYINLFEWSNIPAPESSSGSIPIYSGEPMWKNSATDYTTFCVALNEDVTKHLDSKVPSAEQADIIRLSLDYIDHHYSVVLSRDYKVIKRKTHKGNLADLQKSFGCKPFFQSTQLHNDLKNTSLPEISGLIGENYVANRVQESNHLETDDISRTIITNLKDTQCDTKKNLLIEEIALEPKYCHKEMITSDGSTNDVYEISLPGITSVKMCQLEVLPEQVSLEVSGFKSLRIPLSPLNEDAGITARFLKCTSVLIVTIPQR